MVSLLFFSVTKTNILPRDYFFVFIPVTPMPATRVILRHSCVFYGFLEAETADNELTITTTASVQQTITPPQSSPAAETLTVTPASGKKN